MFAFWDLLPEQHRYAADTLWSNDDFASALPRLAEHINGAPSANSLMLAVMPPAPPEGTQLWDMAFSMVGRLFSGLLCRLAGPCPGRGERRMAT